MDNYAEWINSPETIQIEQSALILGMTVVLERLAQIPAAVPISLGATILYHPMSHHVRTSPDFSKFEFHMRAPELAFKLEVVMRGSHSYKREVLIPLAFISTPELLEEKLRAYLLQESDPPFDVLGFERKV